MPNLFPAISQITLQTLIAAGIVLGITFVAAGFLPRFSRRVAHQSETLAGMLHWMIFLVVWATGIGLVFAILHVPAIPFFSLSTVALSISLGCQQLISNVVDGVALVILKRIRVGDWVSIGGTQGRIIEIHALYLAMQNTLGDRIEMPHAQVFSSTIIHLSPQTIATLEKP